MRIIIERKNFHLAVSVAIAALVGAVLGAIVLENLQIPTISKWGIASTAGYLSVYIAEKVLQCGPSST
jgi:zinc transporter ZupT